MNVNQLQVKPTMRVHFVCACGFTISARSERALLDNQRDHDTYAAAEAQDDIAAIQHALNHGSQKAAH